MEKVSLLNAIAGMWEPFGFKSKTISSVAMISGKVYRLTFITTRAETIGLILIDRLLK